MHVVRLAPCHSLQSSKLAAATHPPLRCLLPRPSAVRQALAIAALCEFGGAVLMGSGVTETIRDQIADLSYFESKPDM